MLAVDVYCLGIKDASPNAIGSDKQTVRLKGRRCFQSKEARTAQCERVIRSVFVRSVAGVVIVASPAAAGR